MASKPTKAPSTHDMRGDRVSVLKRPSPPCMRAALDREIARTRAELRGVKKLKSTPADQCLFLLKSAIVKRDCEWIYQKPDRAYFLTSKSSDIWYVCLGFGSEGRFVTITYKNTKGTFDYEDVTPGTDLQPYVDRVFAAIQTLP